MCPVGYYTMMRTKDHKFETRLHMVQHASTHGIRSAASAHGTTRNTVRKWIRRVEQKGFMPGLREQSRAPRSCPHKLKPEDERRILAQRQRTPGFGARRLKCEFELPYGVSAIARVLRQHGCTRKRRRKHHTKNDLRAVKAAYKAFTRFHMDVKYLNDIPHYWPFMQQPGMPRYQYSIRELPTGASFVSYADGISLTYAQLTVKRFLAHLEQHRIDLSQVRIQTDNGPEFDGQRIHHAPYGFTFTVEGLHSATHGRIPPSCPNANADVESFHNLIETEFFDIENFRSPDQFLLKAITYQNYFNLARRNGSKGNRSPLDILHEKDPTISPGIFLLPPVFLGTLLPAPRASPQGGHHVPSPAEMTRPRPACIYPARADIISPPPSLHYSSAG